MTTATAPATDADPDQEFLDQYRRLNRAQRRRITRAASPELRQTLAAVERDMALKRSPGAMAAVLTDGREKQAPHLDLIDEVFRDIARGHPRKVLITMPPRHGKSRRAARWAPLWFLSRHPDYRVMIASYSADLAEDHGRWIRDAINSYGDQIGIRLHAGSKAANRFDLADINGQRLEGGLVTAGVGGGLTGKGAHLAIVDDPIKDDAEAQSPAMRKRLWDWWTAVMNTRMEPGGSIIVIQTRWHEMDLAGRILLGEDAEDWTVLDLPAIADSENDPLGREIGEPLWPVRYGKKALAAIRRAVGARVWWSLYQQKPRPLEGGVWKWEWITNNRISTMAFRGVDLVRTGVCLDPAGGGAETNDESGITGGGVDETGHAYMIADVSGKLSAEERGRATCLLAIELRADFIAVETNYGGDMARQNVIQAWKQLQREGATGSMVMPRIISVNAKQGKRLRAEPIAQLYEQGMVSHVGELPELENQMVTWVPGMDSPDRMDSGVHLLTELMDPEVAETTSEPYKDNRLGGRR